MLSTIINSWKVKDIRKKIIFTLLMFVVFRFGTQISVPGINKEVLAELFGGAASGIWNMIDLFSGGAFKQISVFAMGIMPYINASIIMNLLTIVFPYFEKLSKEGEEGRKKMTQYTRYGTVVLGFFEALAMSFYLRNALENPSIGSILLVSLTLTAGTVFLMWIGELITERGIGNGISLIIFAGIASRLPAGIENIWQYVKGGQASIVTIIIFVAIALLIVVGVIAIQEGSRNIPVQYAKRVVGRKMYGGQNSTIPIKVNQSGVIPIIFAMSILMFPSTIAGFFSGNSIADFIVKIFGSGHIIYMIIYVLMIIFFTYFYTAVTFNPVDVADNLKKYGGFVPGLRPGRSTAEYLEKILSRITLAGAIFLAFIAVLPNIVQAGTGLPISFGGTSLLIVVGVALDTMKQLESQLLMRSYQGFMK